MRAIIESSGEIKWRVSEGGLQSVKHAGAYVYKMGFSQLADFFGLPYG
jgi:hypothetical protein